MKTKILIPVLVAGVLAAFFSFRYINGHGETNDDHKANILHNVMGAIQDVHFSPLKIDDSFSYKVYHKIIDQLDYDRKFFTQQDINELSQYELTMDDDLEQNGVAFFNLLNADFDKGINKAETFYKEILTHPFTFTGNDSIQLDGQKLPFAADDAALKQRWTTYLKFRVLERFEELKKERDTPPDPKDKKTTKPVRLTDAQLEDSARANVMRNQNQFFKRLRSLDTNERYAIFVNAVTSTEDPHTDYFPPVDKKRFDEQMSGTFIGIGAVLKDDNGLTKIESLVPGAPAAKQGELKAGDAILKVAQGEAEPEDIQGWEIDEVVKKIRGPKGTEVRLTVRHIDGSTKVIRLVRDDVVREETYAKSALIKTKTGTIGYIYLPEFYADFNNANGRRCAPDVAREVEKLKRAGVVGIILDLRNNGGGSLNDVVEMSGDFIDRGPIVQVKNGNGPAMAMKDNEEGTLYDGPLVIMVNQNSASASEILAAAMQDYKRAVIVGSRTYGKGTVQKVVPLDKTNPFENLGADPEDEIGFLKITIQKFYRVNGGSTQHKGVTPDIVLPDPYSYIDLGERHDPAALPWDEIAPAPFRPFSMPVDVNALAAASKKRVAANQAFAIIDASAHRLRARQDNQVAPLNEVQYKATLDKANADNKQLEELQKKSTPFAISNVEEDMQRINNDQLLKDVNDIWIKALQKDIYLTETVNIINDMVNGTAMKTK